MRVALVLGKTQGESVKPRLKSIKDNLDIDTYDGIEDFIVMAVKRNTIYDRIVLLSSKVNQKNLQDLYTYWGETSKETSLVFMGKVGVDDTKAKAFLDLFKTPVVASMLVHSTTVALLAESVLLPPSDLTDRYGIKDFLKYEIDDTAIDAAALLAASNPQPSQPVQPAQPTPAPQNQQMPQGGNEPKEKRTIFSSLFGSKKEKPKKGKAPQPNTPQGQVNPGQQGQMSQQAPVNAPQGQHGYQQMASVPGQGFNNQGVQPQASMQGIPNGASQQGYPQGFGQPGTPQPAQGFPQGQPGALQPAQSFPQGQQMSPPTPQPNMNQGFGTPAGTSQGFGTPAGTSQGFGGQPDTSQGFGGQPDTSQGFGGQPDTSQGFGYQPDTSQGFGTPRVQPDTSQGFGTPRVQPDTSQGFGTPSPGVQPSMEQDFGGAYSEPQTYPQPVVDNVDNFSQSEAGIPNMQTEPSFQQNQTPTWSQPPAYQEPAPMQPVPPQPSAPHQGYNTFANPQRPASPAMNTSNPQQGFGASQPINQQVSAPQPSPVASIDLEEDFGARDFVSVGNTVNEFAPETDLDFGANAGLYHSSQKTPMSKAQQAEIEEVEFDENTMDIAAAEQRYQAQNVRVEVREKVVVKEVGGGSAGVLKAIRAGRMKKVLIVTGDRATGVTSTAYAIATYMAKTTPVLYFDCDIQNHGLLNYIDYGQFRNYENIHINGVPSCKSNKAFQRCVIPWSDDLYLLTSDFTSECNPEDINTAQEVVAETYSEFGLTVVDCPMAYLKYIPDLIMQGSAVICVEGSKRGMMNMLCQLESSDMPMKSKRAIAQKGNFFMTKCTKSTDLKKLFNYIQNFYEPDGVNWLNIPYRPFVGKLDDKLLSEILEG